jgi:hypothetical protein
MEKLIENLIPFFILAVIGINLIRRLMKEQGGQTWKEIQRLRQYPRLPEGQVPPFGTPPSAPSEEWGETEETEPTFVAQAPAEEYRDIRFTTPQSAQRERVAEARQDQPKQEPTLVWEAPQQQVEEFVRRMRERLEVPPPPVFEERKPPVITVPERPKVAVQPQQPPSVERTKEPKPARKRKTAVPEHVPEQIVTNLDEVRRGIILSEILGPPVGLR